VVALEKAHKLGTQDKRAAPDTSQFQSAGRGQVIEFRFGKATRNRGILHLKCQWSRDFDRPANWSLRAPVTAIGYDSRGDSSLELGSYLHDRFIFDDKDAH
jgi:hypothetical protein